MCRLSDCEENPFGLYEVRAGDTVRSVCAEHALTPALLIAANGISAFPPAGSFLVLPHAEGVLYAVSPGETIYSLCQKFGMSEEEFFRMNGCRSVYPVQRVFVRRHKSG